MKKNITNKEFYGIEKDIKKCPFCGGSADISYDGSFRFVYCTSCQSKGKYVDTRNYGSFGNIKSFEDAIDLWNRRVND